MIRDYTDTKTAGIYLQCRKVNRATHISWAMSWIEAENIMQLREIVCDWYYALENGSIQYRLPDLMDNNVTQNKADDLIQILDEEFEIETIQRGHVLDIDCGPNLFRMHPTQRLAFAQSFYAKMLTEEQIEEQAWLRLKAGEKLPPLNWSQEIISSKGDYDD